MFPLHGAKKLVMSSDTEKANEQDEISLEYLNSLSKSSFKKSLILFGENNM